MLYPRVSNGRGILPRLSDSSTWPFIYSSLLRKPSRHTRSYIFRPPTTPQVRNNSTQSPISAPQGKFLFLLAKLSRAVRILEIGTLGGYSTICLARALAPSGKLITLEIDEHSAHVEQANIERAGLAGVVDVRVGPALGTLEEMRDKVLRQGRFDFEFVDADKANNKAYLECALKYSRKETVIVVDNGVKDRKVVDGESKNENVRAVRDVRSFMEMVKGDRRLDATALQAVGVKGWDGFVMVVVVEGDDCDS